MTARFNDSAARSLLLNTLPLDNKLDILLEGQNAMMSDDISTKYDESDELPVGIRSIIDSKLKYIIMYSGNIQLQYS
jgi:hypothetical protein